MNQGTVEGLVAALMGAQQTANENRTGENEDAVVQAAFAVAGSVAVNVARIADALETIAKSKVIEEIGRLKVAQKVGF